MLPARQTHLVLKHKSKHDFISKFEDLSGPKSYQRISALSRPLVRHPVPAVWGKEVSGETSCGCNGREISGEVQDVRAALSPQRESSCRCCSLSSSRHLMSCFLTQQPGKHCVTFMKPRQSGSDLNIRQNFLFLSFTHVY